MTQAPPVVTSDPGQLSGDARVEDVIELLGLVAQLELVAFGRLARDAAAAPTFDERLAFTRFASRAVDRRDAVLERITELGGDPPAALAAYEHVLDEFDVRTPPSSWWERLLKSYVGYGVADDFCRIAAQGIDEGSRALVLRVLDDDAHEALAVRDLDAAGARDDALAARLALWGRRLVGEALGVVQQLLVHRPALVRLVTHRERATGTADQPSQPSQPAQPSQPSQRAQPEDGSVRLFSELTAEHTRRMSRLRLTA